MKIAILGFAGQGRSAYEYWNRDDNELTICDKDTKLDIPAGAQSRLGDDYLKDLDKFDLLVRTPALHPRDIVAANSEDILSKVTTVTNEFLKICPTKNIIGVTGTKGKGTTSTLIAKMLEACSKKVHLGGNIGTPPLELLKNDIKPEDWVVLELANFQLIDLKTSPHIGVCLMVVPEHLDWHETAPQPAYPQGSEQRAGAPDAPSTHSLVPTGTTSEMSETSDTPAINSSSPESRRAEALKEYISAKQQLFMHQTTDDIAIYYAKSENSESIASASKGKLIPYFAPPGAIIENDDIVIDGQSICSTDELKLLGKHNWQNACAAITEVWFSMVSSVEPQIDQNTEAIRKVLTTFTGLEHRLELVREHDGVKYYDDSFGTTPETAIVAMEAFDEPKVVILGGSDKGASYASLAEAVTKNNVRTVVSIGKMGPIISKALLSAGFDHIVEGGKTMQDIVNIAKANAKPGDVVLLSTACASYDLFENYKDRGEQFRSVVTSLT